MAGDSHFLAEEKEALLVWSRRGFFNKSSGGVARKLASGHTLGGMHGSGPAIPYL